MGKNVGQTDKVIRIVVAIIAAIAAFMTGGTLGIVLWMAQRLPMIEWMGARCEGALAHSAFYLDRLRASCPGPVQTAAMPVTGLVGFCPLYRLFGISTRSADQG